jgi:hypothetical protein
VIETWEKRRSSFNHDWLKNRYILALAKFLNLLDDRVEDAEFEQAFISTVLPEWERHKTEAWQIARDFEESMSPKSLFTKAPLCRCDQPTVEWLGRLAHQLWLARYPVAQWVSNVCAQLEAGDEAYQQIQNALKDCRNTQSAEELQKFREYFVEFRQRCQDVANAMSTFPREVNVV